MAANREKLTKIQTVLMSYTQKLGKIREWGYGFNLCASVNGGLSATLTLKGSGNISYSADHKDVAEAIDSIFIAARRHAIRGQ